MFVIVKPSAIAAKSTHSVLVAAAAQHPERTPFPWNHGHDHR